MRSLQHQGESAGKTAAQTGANLMSGAQDIRSSLVPQLERDVNAQHVMTPEQLNEMLTNAAAGAGGATGAFTGEGKLEAARTGQGAGLTPALSAMARTRQQALAKGSEGIAAEDVQGALKRQQMARGELAGLYGTDVNGALQSMGLVPKDVEAGAEAGSTGWFQNMTGLIKALKPSGSFGGGGSPSFGFGGE